MTDLDIPTLDEFKKATKTGMLDIMRSDMSDIDNHLAKYAEAKSKNNAYGMKWEAGELRIALDNWISKTGGSEFKSHDRNKKGALTALDAALPVQKPPPSNSGAHVAETAENLRKGTLFFLSHVELNGGVPEKLLDFASSGGSAVAGVKELAEKANPTAAAGLMSEISSGGFVQPDLGKAPPAEPSGVVAAVINGIKDLLTKLVTMFPGGDAAASFIIAQTPQLVCELLSSVAAHLGAAIAIGKNLAAAFKAAWDYFKSRTLTDGLLSGTPKIVCAAVRQQIAVHGLAGLGKALLEALMAGLATANPALGTIASAIRSIMTFVVKTFLHLRDVFRLKDICASAKQLFADKLYERADEFHDWFSGVVTTLPIVSCYVLAMPMTGSFYGFLSMVKNKSDSDSEGRRTFLFRELEENKQMFEDVKERAREFVAEHSVKLTSTDPVVTLSLDVAKGKKVEIK